MYMTRNFKTITFVNAIKSLDEKESYTKDEFEIAIRREGSLRKETAKRWIEEFIELDMLQNTKDEKIKINENILEYIF
jgi:uncharacterized protein YaaW (UPF0174 family)